MKLDKLLARFARGLFFSAAFLTGLVVMRMMAVPAFTMQLDMSAMVTAAYLLNSLASGTVMFTRQDRSGLLGAMLGLQVGFFDLQRRAAVAGDLAGLADGARNVLATGGILAIASGCAAAAWLRFGPRAHS